MIFNLTCGDGNNPSLQPQFSYSPSDGYQYINQGGNNFIIKFLKSGTLTFSRKNSAKFVDIFCVGQGAAGDWNPGDTSAEGGQGGKCTTTPNVLLSQNSYQIIIGDSPKQRTSSFGSLAKAEGGYGGTGKDTTSRTGGTYAFEDSSFDNGFKYATGGVRGNWINWSTGGSTDAAPRKPNTGEGGDGGRYKTKPDGSGYKSGSGGAGGSGIIIIRNHR